MKAIALPLNIVLTAHKIPHKIAPIHIAKLMDEHKFDVVHETWFFNIQKWAESIEKLMILLSRHQPLLMGFFKFIYLLNQTLLRAIGPFNAKFKTSCVAHVVRGML